MCLKEEEGEGESRVPGMRFFVYRDGFDHAANEIQSATQPVDWPALLYAQVTLCLAIYLTAGLTAGWDRRFGGHRGLTSTVARSVWGSHGPGPLCLTSGCLTSGLPQRRTI